MKGKKGFGILAIGIGAVVVIVIIVLLSTVGFGTGKIKSLTSPSSDYSPTRCPDLGVVVSGTINIGDSAVIDLEPSITSVAVSEVRVNGQNLLAFGEEPFTYSVEASDDITGTKLDESKGTGILRSVDNEGVDKPYSVNFVVPDFDCNRQIDDFNLRLKASIQAEDPGEITDYVQLIRFRGGRVTI